MGLETINWEFLVYSLLHDLAFAVYVGGAVAMEWVLGPAQAAIPPAQAQVMGEKTSDRFLKIVWIALGFIVVTGLLRLYKLNMLTMGWPPFKSPLDFDHSYGRTLIVMIVIWALLVINGAVISFVLRPRLTGRLGAGTSAAQVTASQNMRIDAARWVQYLTRADIVLAVVAVVLGASLRLGGLL